jgi:membrane protease YdiL (CAAX protease family)
LVANPEPDPTPIGGVSPQGWYEAPRPSAPERDTPPTRLAPGGPRWGLGDAALGWLLGQIGGLLTVSFVLAAGGYSVDEFDELPLGLIVLGQVGLWAGLLGVPLVVSRTKGNGLVSDFGLTVRRTDPLVGGLWGFLTQFPIIPLLYWPIVQLANVDVDDLSAPARELTDRAVDPFGVVMLVVFVGIAAPIVEEIFYRGLLQRSLARRFGPTLAVIGTAVIFGVSHMQLLQLPALVVAGLVFGILAQRSGRLGPPIAAHIVFNMVTVVSLVALD